ncbi:unnamed protein product [Linum trigynum]|uniref:Uncharacterized protein n=1 Tax=Linum trigynum TaxID=586398 RepID=A0AAV2DXJ0_9ROSI
MPTSLLSLPRGACASTGDIRLALSHSSSLLSTAAGGGSGEGERGIVVEKLDPVMDDDFVGRNHRRGGRGGSTVYSTWSLELRFCSRRSTSQPPDDVAEGLEMENHGDFFEFEKNEVDLDRNREEEVERIHLWGF